MDTLDLTSIVGRTTAGIVVAIAQTALLHPNESSRARSISNLDGLFSGRLNGGYVGDNQLFLEVLERDQVIPTYVCDLPKEVFGQRNPKAYDFRMPKR
jgi:hypothetical protein